MDFIKTFETKYKTSLGSAIIYGGMVTIRLPNTMKIVQEDYVEGGLGFVVEKRDKGSVKSKYTMTKLPLDMSLLPPEFHGQGYKFKLPAEQISDTEVVFLYSRAKMLNKK